MLRMAPKTVGAVRFLNIHEWQSKQLIQKYGGRAQSGEVAYSPEKSRDIAERLWNQFPGCKFVVKAQVLAGGRGKGHWESGMQGGVKLAKTPEEVEAIANEMLGGKLITKQTGAKGIMCNKVMVCGAVKILKEFYLAILLDRAMGCPVIIATSQGGMGIEEVAQKCPECLFKVPVSVKNGPTDAQLQKLAKDLGLEGDLVQDCVNNVKALYSVFDKCDCTMVEINPLGVIETPTDEKVVCCMDAKLSFDKDAAFRQKDIFILRDKTQEDPRDVRASLADLNYIGLDGDIGCMVNGAGLAMATMDTINYFGGSAANFLDVGGNAKKEQISEALRILRSDKHVKSILINIFGGIMRCDVVAQGIVEAVREAKLDIPLVVRLEGTNVAKGKEILQSSGLNIIPANDLGDAAQKAVASVKH